MKRYACVFCGSRPGNNHSWQTQAEDLGARLAQRNWGLIFGGSNMGLMGAISKSSFLNQGEVIGIMPKNMVSHESLSNHLSELIYVDSIRERKRLMAERADLFIAIPGGIGTMEEFFELWTAKHIGEHDKPLILVNWDGYYNKLLEFIDQSHQDGFLTSIHLERLEVVQTNDELFELLEN